MIERTRYKTLLAGLCALLVHATVPANAEGYRTSVGSGADEIAVVVVRGTPYEMGYALGELTKDESSALLNGFLTMSQATGDERYTNETLDKAWDTMSPFIHERFKEELRGLADGAGIRLEMVRRAHMIPAVSDYSCSSIALWGEATKDGHLYQTRNLDWSMEANAHKYPCIVVYLPNEGIAHFNISFAGFIGSNTGMNAEGIVLSEMGDSPSSDYPFDLNGTHFSIMFRDFLYDVHNLDEALDCFRRAKHIKKYHYVIGDGKHAKKAVKILAHPPDMQIWSDNDRADEFAPNVIANCVYNDEGRGAFPYITKDYGKHDSSTVTEISRSIPIKGGNVLDVVYDATDLKIWVAYAEGSIEAYKRPFVAVDLAQYLDYAPEKHQAMAVASPPKSGSLKALGLLAGLVLVGGGVAVAIKLHAGTG
ncbi:MAG: hypothetical protein IT365_23600 [Candidatus Hydrogenedentes bacterium]|nr:hypothetical protein [Candidatus Hydrogenedentota bacterium]